MIILDALALRGRRTRELLAARSEGQMTLQHRHCFRAVQRAVAERAVDVVVVHVNGRQGHDMVPLVRLQRMQPAVGVIAIAAPSLKPLLRQTFGEHIDDCLEEDPVSGESLFHSIRLALERKRRRGIEDRLQRSDFAMRMAREIQFQLFPVGSPSIEGIEIAGASFPAEDIDGDYYDYFALGDGSLAIAVGDACGHGIAAALLMAETRACLRSAVGNGSDPARILQQVNDVLQEGMPSNRFVTLALMRLDWRRRRVIFASAGHVPGYVMDAAGRIRRRLVSTGMPLGIEAGARFERSGPIRLHPGDIIVVPTDGVAEAPVKGGRCFGIRRFLKLVRHHRHENAPHIIERIYDTVCAASSRPMAMDDITAVVVKVRE